MCHMIYNFIFLNNYLAEILCFIGQYFMHVIHKLYFFFLYIYIGVASVIRQ
jgi:hypothetical protein